MVKRKAVSSSLVMVDDSDDSRDLSGGEIQACYAALHRRKKGRVEGRVSYTTVQKGAIAEYTAVTQADKTSAAKALRSHNWNVHAAINAFFAGTQNTAPNPARVTLAKLFDKYRDNPTDEPDEINAEGTSAMLNEMQIGLDDIGALVFSELVQSPSLGRITRENFIDGCADAGADSLAKIRALVASRRSNLAADKTLFRAVYNHTFVLALAPGQKALPPDLASEFWAMLFAPPGLDWRSPSGDVPWREWWLEFMQGKRAVNRDLWRQTLAFAYASLEDGTLGFWSESASWPSVIDEFVEWVKKEKGVGGGDSLDAMDVEL